MSVFYGKKRPTPVAESAEILILGGGGGGGYNNSGGGGGGGFLTIADYEFLGNVTYTVTVGAGGAGSTIETNAGAIGNNSSLIANLNQPNYSVYFDQGINASIRTNTNLNLQNFTGIGKIGTIEGWFRFNSFNRSYLFGVWV